MKPAKIARQRWVDLAGCACAIAFSILLWRRSAGVGILLLPTLLHNLMIAASFLMRRAPRARDRSFAARLAAYGVTALVPIYLALPGTLAPPVSSTAWAGMAFLLWLSGSLLGLWGIWNLRYSFSIEPQARQLVTSGPYRFVRHPMYAAYVLQYGGILLGRPSAGFALLLAAWMLLLFARIRVEEQVLASAFAGYDGYRRSAGALLPRLRRREAARYSAAAAPSLPVVEVQ